MRSVKIKEILSTIAHSIKESVFIDVEKTKVELKDLSTGNDWKSLRETICAFLNSDGGVVICGVRERKSTYKYTGFNRNNESRIIDLQTKFGSSVNLVERPIKLSDNGKLSPNKVPVGR